jgi:carboxypeptidase Q
MIGISFGVFVAAGQIIPKAPSAFPAPPSGTAGCSLQATCAELAPGMIQSALGDSPLEQNLKQLTTVIGGRIPGSAANEKAAAWVVNAFHAAGVTDVHTETFTLPVGWSEGATLARVIGPNQFSLKLVSTGWSPPVSPAAGIEANLVDVGAGNEADFAKAGTAARGAIVFVHQDSMTSVDGLVDEYARAPAIIDRAVKAHAAAIFWDSVKPGALLYRHLFASGEGALDRITQAIVASDDAERLTSLLASGQPVRVHFEMPNHVTGPVQVKNVVAEIKGWDKPQEFVILGAHLAPWELGQGALDSGRDDAMVIDAARVIHASGSLPRRSIRFVLFNAEEEVLVGSHAYVVAHRAELDNAVSAIIFESGTGAVSGYSVAGRTELIPALKEALDPVKTLGVTNFTSDAAIEAGNFDFLLEGVPTLLPNHGFANRFPNYHASSDTSDKVDLANLKKQSAIAAITVYAIADSPQRIGSRQSRTQVEQLLKDTGLADQMKLYGLWADWSAGKRSRQSSVTQ